MKTKREGVERGLSRRERQIMDIVYRLGEVSVAELLQHIPEPPTAGAARRMLNVLEEKGFLSGRLEGPKKIFSPTVKPEKARASALERVVDTFFAGSSVRAMASLYENSKTKLSRDDLDFLANLINRARREGR